MSITQTVKTAEQIEAEKNMIAAKPEIYVLLEQILAELKKA